MFSNGKEFKGGKKKEKENPKPLPPTGPTKSLGTGFASFVFLVLIALTILLSGCVRISTDIEINGPDRISLVWESKSNTNNILPWQNKFEKSLREIRPDIKIKTDYNGTQSVVAKSISSKEANKLLKQIIISATEPAAIEPPEIRLDLTERNWIIGVQQELSLFLDLSNLTDLPVLDLSVNIASENNKVIRKSSPYSTFDKQNYFKWEIKQGTENKIKLISWQWNKIRIGFILVLFLFCLSIILQTLRLKLGFGFPELPP